MTAREIEQAIDVLLIGSSPQHINLIHEMLSPSLEIRFNIITQQTLYASLDYLQQSTVDLILLNLFLPDGQGLDVLTKMYQRVPSLPIIILADIDDHDLALKAVQLGAQDYLIKDQIDRNLLVRSIYYALERKRIEQDLEQERALLARRVEERMTDLSAANAELARSAHLKDKFSAKS